MFLEVLGALSLVDMITSDGSKSSVTESDVRQAVALGVRRSGVREEDVSEVTAHVMVALKSLEG